MFNDYLRPRRVLPSTGNLRAFDPNGHQHFKAWGCFDFDSFDSLVRSSAEKKQFAHVVVACSLSREVSLETQAVNYITIPISRL